MDLPSTPRRRRRRLVRPDADPAEVLALLRAAPTDVEAIIADVLDGALWMAERYVWAPHDTTELLFGVSLWELPALGAEAVVLARFPEVPTYLRYHPTTLEGAGLPLLAGGNDAQHWEAQLLPGVGEAVPDPLEDPAVHFRLREAARDFVALGGEPQPNPAYHGGGQQEQPR